jgi:hypothetical protein
MAWRPLRGTVISAFGLRSLEGEARGRVPCIPPSINTNISSCSWCAGCIRGQLRQVLSSTVYFTGILHRWCHLRRRRVLWLEKSGLSRKTPNQRHIRAAGSASSSPQPCTAHPPSLLDVTPPRMPSAGIPILSHVFGIHDRVGKSDSPQGCFVASSFV